MNRIDIGMRQFDDPRRNAVVRDVPEESLMLTGDENIVDIDFSVFWVINNAARLPVQHPEPGRHREGGGRERHARGGRPPRHPADPHRRPPDHRDRRAGADAEDAGRLRRRRPDHARSSCRRSTRRARSSTPSATSRRPAPTTSALQNEAQTYANRVVPEARGEAAAITEGAEAYRDRTVAEARGEASRFSQVYDEYKKAPDVTRQRIYLETMERGVRRHGQGDHRREAGRRQQGVVPYLPLDALQPACRPAPGSDAMKAWYFRRYRPRCARCPADPGLFLGVHRRPDPAGAGAALRRAGAGDPRAGPRLQAAADRQRRLLRQAHPRPRRAARRKSSPPTRSGWWSMPSAATRSSDPLRFFQSVGTVAGRQFAALGHPQLRGPPRARRIDLHPGGARRARAADVAHPPAGRSARRATSASRWSTSASAAPTCRRPTARRCSSACRPSASARRRRSAPRASEQAQRIRAEADRDVDGHRRRGQRPRRAGARRGRRRTQPHLRRGLRTRSGLLRLLPLDAGLRGRAEGEATPACMLTPGLRVLPLLQRPVRQEAERPRKALMGHRDPRALTGKP